MLMIEEILCKFDMSVENGWYVDRHVTVIPLPTALVMVMHRRITVKSRLILVSNTFSTRKARPTGIINSPNIIFIFHSVRVPYFNRLKNSTFHKGRNDVNEKAAVHYAFQHILMILKTQSD